MKIVWVGERYELQVLIHYRIGKQRVEKWVTKASGTESYCKQIAEYICNQNE